MFSSLLRLRKTEKGQDLLEYALLASLIAIAAIGAVGFLGQHLNTVFWEAIGPAI
jgi:Flp pilus assembly pilin Flp